MFRPSAWHLFSLSLVTLVFLSAADAFCQGRLGVEVQGRLSELDGAPVLYLYGTPEERGFAQGYLLADSIAPMFNAILLTGLFSVDKETYEDRMVPLLERTVFPEHLEAELSGLIKGMEARLGGPVKVPWLERTLDVKDLKLLNCVSDLAYFGCSSIVAWNNLTGDGGTLAGRNMDWTPLEALIDRQIMVVYAPLENHGLLGWVSVTWPAYIGCITGMNAEGVAVYTHDANGFPTSVEKGITPSGFIFREAVEKARAETAFEDIRKVLSERVSPRGLNMGVARPFSGKGFGGMVFEFDGDKGRKKGLSMRTPDLFSNYVVCTNHFRKRKPKISCIRFHTLEDRLKKIQEAWDTESLSIEEVWDLLAAVSLGPEITFHSAVWEPNKKLMHLALSEGKKSAPLCKKRTLDVTKLLAECTPND